MNIDINDTINNTKDVIMDFDFDMGTKQINKVVSKAVDTGADYVIKSMPIPDPFKDILVDIKNSLKKDGFKNLIKTAVNSSIREGLEILNMPKQIVKDVISIKDAALKGGLKQALGNVIDIVANKYLKNNLAAQFVKDFFKNMKDYIFSKQFAERLESGFKKITEKKDKFMETCQNWYMNYEKQDINNMNMVADDLKSKYNTVKNDKQCERENSIIQNITKLYNEKKDKLSDAELQLCQNM